MRAWVVSLVALAACGADQAPEPDAWSPVGSSVAELGFERWIGDELVLRRDAEERPTATLLRWWTDGCAFCEESLPAIDALRREWADAGLEVVAVYHPKPPRAVPDDEIAAAAQERGYGGRIAVDERAYALERVWPEAPAGELVSRPAMSISLLVDSEGIVRFAHGGPELHPPRDGAEPRRGHEKCAHDYSAMRAEVRALLKPPG